MEIAIKQVWSENAKLWHIWALSKALRKLINFSIHSISINLFNSQYI